MVCTDLTVTESCKHSPVKRSLPSTADHFCTMYKSVIAQWPPYEMLAGRHPFTSTAAPPKRTRLSFGGERGERGA